MIGTLATTNNQSQSIERVLIQWVNRTENAKSKWLNRLFTIVSETRTMALVDSPSWYCSCCIQSPVKEWLVITRHIMHTPLTIRNRKRKED